MSAYGIAGNPAEMRAAAATLRGVAALLGGDSSRIAKNVGAMDYAGPAAGRFKGDLGLWQFESGGVRSELEAIAAELIAEAARVAEQQEEARREAARREREEHSELARRR